MDGQEKPTRRKRSSVTPEEILHASEHIARGGFDALTMRAVASHIGSSPMALYRYFPTKDLLIDALLDQVLGRMDFEEPTDDWVVDLRRFAHAHRTVLAQHPWAVVALFSHSNPGLNATIIGERAFRILDRGGIVGARAVATFCAIVAMNYGWSAFTAVRDGTVDAEGVLAQQLSSLPAGSFPATMSVADDLSHFGNDAQYRMALDQLILGVSGPLDNPSM